jgi:type III restriction enzyme
LGREAAKIECGERHFANIARSATEPAFTVARAVEDLMAEAALVP